MRIGFSKGKIVVKKYFIKISFFFVGNETMAYAPHIQVGIKNNNMIGISWHNNSCLGINIMFIDFLLHLGIDKYNIEGNNEKL